MECKFYVGQKVTPITDIWSQIDTGRVDPDIFKPVKGKIYMIRSIELINGIIGIRLAGINNPIKDYIGGCGECVYEASWFRPVDERKTDISIFRQLLTPSGQKRPIREDA